MVHRWAFLVGINRYTDPNFNTLQFCVNDVLALEEVLKQVGYEDALQSFDEQPLPDSQLTEKHSIPYPELLFKLRQDFQKHAS